MSGETILELPVNSEVLTVKIRNERINLWAIVNPKNPTIERCFKVICTGEEIGDDSLENYEYIDSLILNRPAYEYVFHVFKKKILKQNIINSGVIVYKV